MKRVASWCGLVACAIGIIALLFAFSPPPAATRGQQLANEFVLQTLRPRPRPADVCGPWDELPPEVVREAVQRGFERAQQQLSDTRKALDAAAAQGVATEISTAEKRVAALEHAVAILSEWTKEQSEKKTTIASGAAAPAAKSASCNKS
jgi:hypothetical protein